MIYLITMISFVVIIGIFTISYILLKINSQRKLKNERIKLLSNNEQIMLNSCVFQFVNELYLESYSHYTTYCIGHFFSILLNIYSVLFSVTALTTITIESISNYSQTISLISTFFVITLVFAHLDERSTNHLLLWRKCENVIVDILSLSSIDEHKTDIYTIISTYHNK